MTETATESTEAEEFTPIPLENIPHVWMADGAPCFLATVPNIREHIEAHGYPIYYLIGTKKEEVKKDGVTKTIERPATFKVIKNFINEAVVEVDIDMPVIAETVGYRLPKIPVSLQDKLDLFFREVHKDFGTEAIVILTFDPTVTDEDGEYLEDGWGVVIPEQTNTASFCDYDPPSVAEEKPDHVFIVGTVHSHPGMSAFASGTDHKDQANFPGLHITYGWMKSKGDVTEYHIELQVSPSSSFTLRPEQVFSTPPRPEVDDSDLEDWKSKVSKKTTTVTTSSTSGTKWGNTQGGYQGTYRGTSSTGGYKTTSPEQRRITVPKGCPDVEDNIVIGVLRDKDDRTCPFCKTSLIAPELEKRRCMACHQLFAYPGETLEELYELRKESKVFSHDISPQNRNSKDVWFWIRPVALDGDDEYVHVREAVASGK